MDVKCGNFGLFYYFITPWRLLTQFYLIDKRITHNPLPLRIQSLPITFFCQQP